MLKDIVAAHALSDYCLHLQFDDGVEGVVDLASHLSFRGVFEPLRDPACWFVSNRNWAPWLGRTERTSILTFSMDGTPLGAVK